MCTQYYPHRGRLSLQKSAFSLKIRRLNIQEMATVTKGWPISAQWLVTFQRILLNRAQIAQYLDNNIF